MTAEEREQFLQNGYTKDQLDEIELGRRKGLDTSLYENKEFLSVQMRQIRFGLERHLDARKYARVEFDWLQMEEIREGMKAGLNVDLYASPEISFEKMRQVRKGLMAGMNLAPYLKLDAGIMRQIRKATLAGVNILKFINEGYDAQQLEEIKESLVWGVDIAPYLSKNYRAASITQISKGLYRKLDVSLYAKEYYSWRQMREIRKGLENRVDVSLYNDKLYSWEQMREVRLGLEAGLDVSEYRLLRYTANEMKRKRLALLSGELPGEEASLEEQLQTGDLMFTFASGEMEAYVTVLVPGKVITRKNLMERLEESGIVKGVIDEVIDQLVEGRYGERPLLIARGNIPYKGEDGWYEYFFRTDLNRRPKVMEDGSVDYQNIEWFEMVHAGQKVAYYHEAKEGQEGYTVTGKPIPARKGFEQRVLVGKGFKLEDDKKTYIALADGMVQLEGNELKITDHLEVDEVNLATGNVSFSGSVHIRGDVTTGTTVRAGGDVVVDGNVEGATIISNGSVILKKGMNGTASGMIHSDKDVVSRFFEAVTVVAKGNIEVDKCLNSELCAGGKITSTRVIAGGVAQAEKGFRVQNVGNQAGRETTLKVLVNEEDWQQYKQIKNEIKEIAQEVQMLNKTYEEFKAKYPPEVRSQMEVFGKVEKAVSIKTKYLQKLLEKKRLLDETVRASNDAKVIIGGRAHEGVVVEMSGCRWFAENQFNITLKKQNQQLEIISN